MNHSQFITGPIHDANTPVLPEGSPEAWAAICRVRVANFGKKGEDTRPVRELGRIVMPKPPKAGVPTKTIRCEGCAANFESVTTSHARYCVDCRRGRSEAAREQWRQRKRAEAGAA